MDERPHISSAREEDPLDPAGGLAEGIRAVRAAVSGMELFERFFIEQDDDTIQRQLKQGKPLLDPGHIQIGNAATERVFALLLQVFREYLAEKAEDWARLEHGIRGGSIRVRELLEATLQHRWDMLQAWAGEFSIDIDALQFFTIYLARPFRQEAAESLWDETGVAFWQEGYCPVCGHSPVLGRLIGSPGHRCLWCCCCNTAWSYPRIGCPFCQNQVQDRLGHLTVTEFASHRIYVCDTCRRYLKTIVCPEESGQDGWDYDREYLSTVALDAVAVREGYVAEPVWLAHSRQPLLAREGADASHEGQGNSCGSLSD